MKKTADQFIDAMLTGEFVDPSLSYDDNLAKVAQVIESDYSFTDEEMKEAFAKAGDRIESTIGVRLTDEQLAAVTGGKGLSTGAKAGIGVGTAVGGIGAAAATGWIVSGAVYVGLFFIIK